MTAIGVTLWICPNCLRYFGASGAGNLREKMNTDHKNRPTFPRSRCGYCKTERIPHRMAVEVIKEEAVA